MRPRLWPAIGSNSIRLFPASSASIAMCRRACTSRRSRTARRIPGQCHRSFADVVRSRLFGQINVRFQPYRLEKSKGFDGSDGRFICIGCHDPHREVVRGTKSYDQNCLGCHGTQAKAASVVKSCPVAKSDCTSCHMPKTELPGSHHMFTDHFIRVVRANESYPIEPLVRQSPLTYVRGSVRS